MEAQGVESRVHQRHPLRTRGKLLFDGHAPIPVRTIDISVGGLCLVSEVTLPAKIKGNLVFNMPVGHGKFEEKNLKIQILHSIFCNKEDGFKLGVMFLSPPPELLKLIQNMS
jgi:c-di-GMP-binding flagellar brake protein YcgR